MVLGKLVPGGEAGNVVGDHYVQRFRPRPRKINLLPALQGYARRKYPIAEFGGSVRPTVRVVELSACGGLLKFCPSLSVELRSFVRFLTVDSLHGIAEYSK